MAPALPTCPVVPAGGPILSIPCTPASGGGTSSGGIVGNEAGAMIHFGVDEATSILAANWPIVASIAVLFMVWGVLELIARNKEPKQLKLF